MKVIESAPWSISGDYIVGRPRRHDQDNQPPAPNLYSESTIVAEVPSVGLGEGRGNYCHYPSEIAEIHRHIIANAPQTVAALCELKQALEVFDIHGYATRLPSPRISRLVTALQQAGNVLNKQPAAPVAEPETILDLLTEADSTSADLLASLDKAKKMANGGLVNLLLLDLVRQASELSVRINAVKGAAEREANNR